MKFFHYLFVLLLVCSCHDISKSKTETGLEGNMLPSFDLLLVKDSTKLNTGNIHEGQPFVLFYFSPDCPYCKSQTEDIINNIKTLKNIHFYFVSPFPFQALKEYYNFYHLRNYSNVTVGRDLNIFFQNYYKANSVPYLAIYKNDKKLSKILIGKVNTTIIKSHVFD